MEWDSGQPYNSDEERKTKRLQELRESMQQQEDLSATLSSSCKYFLSYYPSKIHTYIYIYIHIYIYIIYIYIYIYCVKPE